MNDEQPTQPITDAELARMDRELTDAVERDGEWYLTTDAPRDMRRLLAEVDRLRAALTALGRNEQAAGNHALELQEENDRLRLEIAQMESGAQIAMNAGVTALQEVKRLEAMIAAVVAIHKPTAMNSWGHRTCTECDTPGYYQEWPCPTLAALGFEEQ